MLGCFRRRSTLMSASSPLRCTATLPLTAAARGTRTCAGLIATSLLLCRLVWRVADAGIQAAGVCSQLPPGPTPACCGIFGAAAVSGGTQAAHHTAKAQPVRTTYTMITQRNPSFIIIFSNLSFGGACLSAMGRPELFFQHTREFQIMTSCGYFDDHCTAPA
jgi:hypothetical protein